MNASYWVFLGAMMLITFVMLFAMLISLKLQKQLLNNLSHNLRTLKHFIEAGYDK